MAFRSRSHSAEKFFIKSLLTTAHSMRGLMNPSLLLRDTPSPKVFSEDLYTMMLA